MENNRLYSNKIILAPMVRVGTLPFRILALEYGADLVYTEELIDWKLLKTKRIQNDVLKTVDFVNTSDGTIVFRTCDREKDKVIIQIGTSDPQRALAAAKLVENDVAGIDVNMGCPKEFSLKGGMGAALMKQPDRACAILKCLSDNLKIPVSCKIRILPSLKETLDLVKKLARTGITAIAVHGRTISERPRHENHNDVLREISKTIDIQVIANGGSKDIDNYNDIIRFKQATECNSCMIARAAQWNCSIFRSKGGKLQLEQVIIDYLRYAVDYDNAPSNTKYAIQTMLRELQETPLGKQFLECQTLEQICDVWSIGDYFRRKQCEYQSKGYFGRLEVTPGLDDDKKKRKFDEIADENILKLRCVFLRRNFEIDSNLPKSKLLSWALKHKLKKPFYETVQQHKLFRSIVLFNNNKYSSSYW